MLETLRKWARVLKAEVAALYLAARDARTPLAAKLVAIAVVAYALSPVDLIPDFIPVIGYLDDLLLVPLGILLAVRLIPAPLMAEFRTRAAGQGRLPASRGGAIAIACLWIAAAVALVYAAISGSG